MERGEGEGAHQFGETAEELELQRKMGEGCRRKDLPPGALCVSGTGEGCLSPMQLSACVRLWCGLFVHEGWKANSQGTKLFGEFRHRGKTVFFFVIPIYL